MESLNSNSQERELHQLQQMQDKAKESCMVSFRLLHSHLKVLSNNDLKGTRIERGFEQAFATLFDQDVQTFTGTMMNERRMQSKEENIDSSKVLDASLVVTKCRRTKSEKHDTSSRSGNDTHAEDANIKPHAEQLKFNNEGRVDEDAKQCQVKSPLLYAELFKMKDMVEKEVYNELENRFVELENIINELKAQLQAKNTTISNLKKQIKIVHETSNEAKVKNDIDVLETINIELEHSVAKLLAENEQLHKENEHLKQTYKDLYNSIKKTRVQTKGHTDSLIVQMNCSTPYVPPTKNDWEILFQPMFDEYLNHPPCVDLQFPTVIAPEPAVSTGSPSSTTIDQDASSTSTSQTNQETPSLVIPLGVKEADWNGYL
ncbi:hypothetical protein Tco_0472459 [Tanacetum coccineum]